jgi:hypothetical protein
VRVLFDQGTPVPLRESLGEHDISTAYERGWSTLKNSDLLDAAEREGFEVLLTTDKNREEINEELQSIIDEQTDPWGVKVSVVEAKAAGRVHGRAHPTPPSDDKARSCGACYWNRYMVSIGTARMSLPHPTTRRERD